MNVDMLENRKVGTKMLLVEGIMKLSPLPFKIKFGNYLKIALLSGHAIFIKLLHIWGDRIFSFHFVCACVLLSPCC